MIYTITAIEKRENKMPNNRTFGYFTSLKRSFLAVEHNEYDMHEGSYNFIVIEKLRTGIHPVPPEDEWWYRWHKDDERWVFLGNGRFGGRPKQFSHVCNWSIG